MWAIFFGQEKEGHAQPVIHAQIMQFQDGATQGEIFSIARPAFVGHHHVWTGVRLHPSIGFLVGHRNGSGIMEHLPAARIISVIMAVQEIPSGLVRDGLDGVDHVLRMVRIR